MQPRMGGPMMMQGRPVMQQVAPPQAAPGMSPVSPQAPLTCAPTAPVNTQKQQGTFPTAQSVMTKYEDFDDDSGEDTDGDDDGGSKKKRPRTNRKMTEEQKVERR